ELIRFYSRLLPGFWSFEPGAYRSVRIEKSTILQIKLFIFHSTRIIHAIAFSSGIVCSKCNFIEFYPLSFCGTHPLVSKVHLSFFIAITSRKIFQKGIQTLQISMCLWPAETGDKPPLPFFRSIKISRKNSMRRIDQHAM